MLRAIVTPTPDSTEAYSTRAVSPCLLSALLSRPASCVVRGAALAVGRMTPTVARTGSWGANPGAAAPVGTSTAQAATGAGPPVGAPSGGLLSLELHPHRASAAAAARAATEDEIRRTRTGISPNHAAPGLPGRDPPVLRPATGADVAACCLR